MGLFDTPKQEKYNLTVKLIDGTERKFQYASIQYSIEFKVLQVREGKAIHNFPLNNVIEIIQIRD